MTMGKSNRAILRAHPAFSLAILSLASLSACAGDSAPTPTPTPVANRAPTFTSAATAVVVENTAGTAYQAAATDPDGNALVYSVVGGADAGRFSISATGQLASTGSLNFEAPVDSDRDNVYQVQIGVSDGQVSTMLSLALSVTNSKEGIAVRRIATGFANPVAMSVVDETTILVAEKAGVVHVLNWTRGERLPLVQIQGLGPVGITAIAAAPSFVSTGAFFVMAKDQSGTLIVDRYLGLYPTIPRNVGRAVSEYAPQYAGGGWLGFDADGNLLAATGDAGGSGDAAASAQSDAALLGKLIRLVPNPDPYAGASVPKTVFLATILAKGLRWPSGGSQFGQGLLIADRGQDVAQELNLFTSGGTVPNYGWPFKEGTRVVRGTPPAVLVDPVLEYFRSTGPHTGQAIVGGGRGPRAIASLIDSYVFADESGAIFTVAFASIAAGVTLSSDGFERRDADFTPDQGTIDRPVAIATGFDGTLYILDGDGEVFRVNAG